MKDKTPIHSDAALGAHPDDRHAPEAGVHPDKLGTQRGRGQTGLRPGGGSDAETLLDQQSLERPRERSGDNTN